MKIVPENKDDCTQLLLNTFGELAELAKTTEGENQAEAVRLMIEIHKELFR